MLAPFGLLLLLHLHMILEEVAQQMASSNPQLAWLTVHRLGLGARLPVRLGSARWWRTVRHGRHDRNGCDGKLILIARANRGKTSSCKQPQKQQVLRDRRRMRSKGLLISMACLQKKAAMAMSARSVSYRLRRGRCLTARSVSYRCPCLGCASLLSLNWARTG